MSKWIRFEFNYLDPFTCVPGGMFAVNEEKYLIKRVYKKLNRVYCVPLETEDK
jgi:hypothetical protein